MKKSEINKYSKTKIFFSISSNPGIVGTVFYNRMFQKLNFNMIYKAIKPTNLKKLFISLRELGVNGCSVSMPFKKTVIKYLDKVDPVCLKTNAVNTIINNGNKLYGYNCDFLAIKKIFKIYNINKKQRILIIVYLLKKKKLNNFKIIGRNNNKIKKIQNDYKFKNLNFDKFDILINASALGMKGFENKIPFSNDQIAKSKLIIDYVNKPSNTSLIKIAKKRKINYCSGIEISSYQLFYQFKLYTGKKLPFKNFSNFK